MIFTFVARYEIFPTVDVDGFSLSMDWVFLNLLVFGGVFQVLEFYRPRDRNVSKAKFLNWSFFFFLVSHLLLDVLNGIIFLPHSFFHGNLIDLNTLAIPVQLILLFITEGKGSHTIDFMDYTYQKGTLLTIRKDQIHKFTKSNSPQGYLLIFMMFIKNMPLKHLLQLSMPKKKVK